MNFASFTELVHVPVILSLTINAHVNPNVPREETPLSILVHAHERTSHRSCSEQRDIASIIACEDATR